MGCPQWERASMITSIWSTRKVKSREFKESLPTLFRGGREPNSLAPICWFIHFTTTVKRSKQNQIKQVPAEARDALFPAPAMRKTAGACTPLSQPTRGQTNLKHANEMKFYSATGKGLSPPGMEQNQLKELILCRFTLLKVTHWSFPVDLRLQSLKWKHLQG